MAGFFGFFDYTRPGPGVPKDAPPKHPIIVFFQVFSRKFWNLVKLNILFMLFNLPALIAVMLAMGYIFQNPMFEDAISDLIMRFIFGSILICIPVITVGPAQAGFTYVLRNYSREEHAFLWWDFKDNAILNFKESIIISIIDLVVVILFGININFYLTNGSNNILTTIASTLLIMAFTIFIMMHMYIYPMLVTFKLSIKQIYKNAFVFALMKFIPNLGLLLLCILLIFLSFLNTIIGIVLFPLLTVSTIGLIINSYVYPKLKKYMIDKVDSDDEVKENANKG